MIEDRRGRAGPHSLAFATRASAFPRRNRPRSSKLHPGRRLHHPRVRRNRPGHDHFQETGGNDGRPHRRGKRSRAKGARFWFELTFAKPAATDSAAPRGARRWRGSASSSSTTTRPPLYCRPISVVVGLPPRRGRRRRGGPGHLADRGRNRGAIRPDLDRSPHAGHGRRPHAAPSRRSRRSKAFPRSCSPRWPHVDTTHESLAGAGIRGCLTKPVKRHELRATIEAVLVGGGRSRTSPTAVVSRAMIAEARPNKARILLVEDYRRTNWSPPSTCTTRATTSIWPKTAKRP